MDFIIWGPSAKLTGESEVVKEEIKLLQNVGVNVRACISCSDKSGVTDALRTMGIEVERMGPVLTDALKSGTKVLTI